MYNYIFNDNFRNMNNNSYNMMTDIDTIMGMKVNQPALFDPSEAYNNGNLYVNLYSQYKNFKPDKLKAKNEKDQMLLDLSRLSFAAHELNLYLDLHPDDESMLALFNDYRSEANALIKHYEMKYGPLNISSDALEKGPFAWVSKTWPWEDKYYV